MGLDLKLLPIEAEGVVVFSHTVLNCERASELFERILDIEKRLGRDVPDGFMSYLSREEEYEEEHYGLTLESPYGRALKCVTARSLVDLDCHPDVAYVAKNCAVWAYLEMIPRDTKIVLYWH